MFRELFHYVDKPSYIHRLDPRAKLVLLVPIFLATMISNNAIILLLVFSSVLFINLLSKIPFRRYKAPMIVSLLSSFSFVFFGAFFYFGFYHNPEKPLHIWLWIFRPEDAESLPILGSIILGLTGGRGIILCEEGFFWGILTTVKFLITVFSSNLVLMTTKPKDILLALNKFGMPFKFTFAAVTALRFIPVIMEEWYVTMSAQRARGLKFKKLNVKGIVGALMTSFSILIVNSIRRARILAFAMETRAFGANKKRVPLKELKMTRLDFAVILIIFIITVSVLIFSHRL